MLMRQACLKGKEERQSSKPSPGSRNLSAHHLHVNSQQCPGLDSMKNTGWLFSLSQL